MTTLFLDTETFSETPIKNGTFRYAADAEVLVVAYAIDEGPVQVWDVTSGAKMPVELHAALCNRELPITAHNAQFDANVLHLAKNSDEVMRAAGENVERWRCTMAQALSHSLPAKLSALGAVLHLPAEMLKDEGGELIHLFCKPLTRGDLKRATAKTHPEQWQRFLRYAGQDIVAMRECARRMPKWNWQARDIACWHLDQRINRRGFAVDVDLAEGAIRLCTREAKDNAAKTEMLTGGAVEKVTQRDRLMKHVLAEHGVDLPDLRATTLERRIEDPDLPWAVRELLALRLSGSKNSISKYRTLLRAVSADGRLRGGLQFRGAARTGRDAGRLFQPQNLPRPEHKPATVEAWIGALKAGATDLLGFDDVQLAGDALRGCIVAAPGCKIVQADFSNIEGRIVAWYADERWKLDAFRAFDRGEGEDLYKITYGRAFNVDPSTVDKQQRDRGKVIDLAGGFQGWVGACMTFASLYRIDLDEDTAARWMGQWRDAHPEVVRLWYRIDECARLAIQNPDKVFEVNDKIRLARRGPWLKVQLPSGRILSYPHVGFSVHGEITYHGQDQYTRKWSTLKSYGGKLFENIVQATAADLLWAAIPKAEAAGYPVILRVHDELLTEPLDDARFSVAGLAKLMTDTPAWAAGLPVAAAGFEAQRYKKA